MTSTSSTAPVAGRTTATPLLRAFQVGAALTVLNVFVQFVTAGQLFPSGGPDGAHAAGAIVLHVVSGLTAVAAVVLWRQGVLGLGTTALAVLVFAYGFVQAAIGGYSSLYVHVPGAMLLAGGAVWLLVAALRRQASSSR